MSMKAPGSGLSTPGADGPSAYAIAVQNGFVGTQTQWLSSLAGTNGTNGARGNTISAGTGAPGLSGITGDLYIDTATGNLWQF